MHSPCTWGLRKGERKEREKGGVAVNLAVNVTGSNPKADYVKNLLMPLSKALNSNFSCKSLWISASAKLLRCKWRERGQTVFLYAGRLTCVVDSAYHFLWLIFEGTQRLWRRKERRSAALSLSLHYEFQSFIIKALSLSVSLSLSLCVSAVLDPVYQLPWAGKKADMSCLHRGCVSRLSEGNHCVHSTIC